MSFVKVNVFQALAGVFSGVLIIWLVLRYFKLRRYRQLSQNVPSWYWNLPLIGIAHLCIGSCETIQRRFLHLMTWCPKISKFWLGDYLIYVVNSAEYLDGILKETKKPVQYRLLEPLLGNGLGTNAVETWKRHRKMITPAFSQRNINDAIEIVNEQSEILIKLLSEAPSKKDVDIGKYLINCTGEIIGQSIFNVTMNAQIAKTLCNHEFHYLLESTFKRAVTIWHYPDFAYALLSERAKETKLILEKYDNLLRYVTTMKTTDCVDRFEYDDSKKNTFFDSLNKNYENKQITLKEIEGEVKTLAVAGFDTTATNLGFILILLAMHPEIQEKVYAETVDILGPDRPVGLEDLNKFQYTENVIKETLRLYPTVPIIARELQQDVPCGDILLPQGAIVVVPLISVQRNEKYWKDPLKFDPDRFLPENSENRHPNSYLPFALGPRNCIGFKFAMMELKIVVPMLIRKFRLTCDKSLQKVEDIETVLNVVLNAKNPIRLNLEMR